MQQSMFDNNEELAKNDHNLKQIEWTIPINIGDPALWNNFLCKMFDVYKRQMDNRTHCDIEGAFNAWHEDLADKIQKNARLWRAKEGYEITYYGDKIK